MSELEDLLEQQRPQLEAALREAERELAELDERRAQLLALIARAQAAMGISPPRGSRPIGRKLTLHEAMAEVLERSPGEQMSARDLAVAVNEAGLYEKRDQTPVDPGQIHARAGKYPALFEKQDGQIRLRS